MRIGSSLRQLGVVASVAAAGLALAAAPAAAADQDGACNSGEFCVYDNTFRTGSHSDFYNDLSNYGTKKFWNSPYYLNDNIESAKNTGVWLTVRAYVDANYSGAWDFWDTGQLRDVLDIEYDGRLSSHEWL